jgi:hypothetical protein
VSAFRRLLWLATQHHNYAFVRVCRRRWDCSVHSRYRQVTIPSTMPARLQIIRSMSQ